MKREYTHTPLEVAEGILSGKYTITSVYVLVNQIEDLTRERDEARSKETDYGEGFEEGWAAAQKGAVAEVEKLRAALKIAAGYVMSCYHEWHLTQDRAEALRDLTKIRAALNGERAGELEVNRTELEAKP